MKKSKLIYLIVLICFFPLILKGQSDWKIAGDKIRTSWAEKVDPNNTLPEYPRPHLVRENWMNLNGLWDYAILPKNNEKKKPAAFNGKILVPFPVESALSGVGKRVNEDSELWYKRTVEIPKKMRQGDVLLHFGAVDWECEVFVNGKRVGEHKGGYDPFSFNITSQLKPESKQEILVRVWDPTDKGPQPRGKQVKEPKSIWYTPVSGIWQTVWMEGVPKSYIIGTRQTPDIDRNVLKFSALVKNGAKGDVMMVSAWDGKTKISETKLNYDSKAELEIKNPKLWSPENPFLYDLKIALYRNGKLLDEVNSYFAMRKISMEKDENGIQKMMLNNQFVFQFGPLDQGWWPDGLYTAPTDEALLFDVVKTKEMGFNMIRKHVKVEPARWYYHCDRVGMLVWQDMPNGDWGGRWSDRPGIEGIGQDMERSPASEEIYYREWDAIMESFHNFPSIVVWVPFNEGWGQFKTAEVTKFTMEKDPSRLVNSASGGNFIGVGHILDIHNYPEPGMPRSELFGKNFILALGEYGGLGLPVKNHTWQEEKNWGYRNFENVDDLFERYEEFIKRLNLLIPKGLSAAIYTQTTDVEIEVNGLMTYDRKVIKIPAEKLKALHQPLYRSVLAEKK
jgi:beta-galactosidase/beta-glucuronidase